MQVRDESAELDKVKIDMVVGKGAEGESQSRVELSVRRGQGSCWVKVVEV
jgi:hypothetical protein